MNSLLRLTGVCLVVTLLLSSTPGAHAAGCSGWSVDRNRLGTLERDHGSLRITTAEGVWKWEYGADKLLEFYAVAFKVPDVRTREKKLAKFKKRFTAKHGEPTTNNPYEETTEEYLQSFLAADQHGNGNDRWLEDVSSDGVWFSEECNAHLSLYRGRGGGDHYVIVLLHPVIRPAEK